MAIVINGSGTVTGLAVGGLPDGTVDAGTLASNAVTEAKIASNAVVTAKLNDDAVTNAKMANDAITEHELAGSAVVTAAINDDAITAAKLASGVGGKVLQIVSSSANTALTTNSTSMVDLMTLAITPSASSSKILIMYNSSMAYQDSGSANFYNHVGIFRDSTALGNGNDGHAGNYFHSFSYNDVGTSFNCHHLDSPNTTSSITYRIKVRTNNSSASFIYGLAGKDSLTLMEIAG